MASIEPYSFREKTNLQEHNDIINKVNEIVDVINDTDLDNLGTRLTNDESQIAVNTTAIKANTTAIDGLIDSVDTIDKTLDTIEPMVTNHETDIANLKESERRLSNDVVSTYTLYRNGEGKLKMQAETVGGTLIDSNTLDMIIPYQYDIISGTTDRSFKLNITMSDGSSYTTNDFVIPDGGGSEIVVTGITLSKDSTNVNRFHVGINLSDSTMIDSGYISMVDNVVATYADSKLTISVNGVSSVPVAIETGSNYTAGNGITITSGTIAIDDTVVALKSDIADMETKTNASATYATKTALASTDANVALAQSTADDANNKANSAIDNVSINGSTMSFTKINDEHIDVIIPSVSIKSKVDLIEINPMSIYSASSSVSTTGRCGYAPYYNSSFHTVDIGGSYVTIPLAFQESFTKNYQTSAIETTNSQIIANKFFSGLSASDGQYYLTVCPAIYYNYTTSAGKLLIIPLNKPIYMVVTISDGEIIEVKSLGTDAFWFPNTTYLGSSLSTVVVIDAVRSDYS